MKLVLIGFMGSGKSTVAKLLSNYLNLKLYELDDLIILASSRKTIKEIFESDGETHFRAIEQKVLIDALKNDNSILSTGGGVVQNLQNREILKKSGTIIIYLSTTFNEIVKRINNPSDRPLFKDLDQARNLYDNRKNIYQELADFIIVSDGKTPEQVALEIKELF